MRQVTKVPCPIRSNAAGFEEYFRKNNADITVRCIQDLYRAEANRQQMLACLREDKSIIGAYSVRARNTIPLCERQWIRKD